MEFFKAAAYPPTVDRAFGKGDINHIGLGGIHIGDFEQGLNSEALAEAI